MNGPNRDDYSHDDLRSTHRNRNYVALRESGRHAYIDALTFAFCRAERSAQRKAGVGQQRVVRPHSLNYSLVYETTTQ